MAGAPQAGEHRGIEPPAQALAQGWTVPVQPEPLQVLEDGLLRTRSVAGGIEIIEAQEPLATAAPSLQPAQQGCAQVAPMQHSSGGGGKTPPVPLAAPLQSRLQ